jgi:hypothetical protein
MNYVMFVLYVYLFIYSNFSYYEDDIEIKSGIPFLHKNNMEFEQKWILKNIDVDIFRRLVV